MDTRHFDTQHLDTQHLDSQHFDTQHLDPIIRYRYNTMAHETPDGAWKWRVILERDRGSFEEVLVTELHVNVPSFSREDDMPVVGRKYHMACYGVFRQKDGVGTIDAH